MLPVLDIDTILLSWAANENFFDGFTVGNVLSALGLNTSYYPSVFRYLMTKQGFGLLPKKVLLCSQNHKGASFMLNEKLDEDDIYTCKICGEDYNPLPDNMMIVFGFEDEFREQAKKKLFLTV